MLRSVRLPALALTRDRLVMAITLLALLAMATRVAFDSDTWWHLRAGAWMVEHRQVLTEDVFSTNFAGSRWEYPAWLSQVCMYLVFSRWGYSGLNALTALAVVAAFVLVYATCPGNVYVRAGAVILAAAASAVFWSARPHIFSFVLAAAMLYVLDRYRRRGINQLWLLPPLMALWANIHPAFAVGFIVLGLTLAGEVTRALLGRGGWRRAAWLAGVSVACLGALLLTPYGPGLVVYPFKTVAISTLQDFIQEWQSPNFHMREAQPIIWLWLATFAALGLSRRRLEPAAFFLLAGLLAMALLAGRNVALFALVAAPVLARHAQAVVDDVSAAHPHWAAALERQAQQASRVAPVLNWLVLALIALATALKMALPLEPRLSASLALRDMPEGAANYLLREHPAGPLFNPYQWGGYLAWRLYPEYSVYVDGRTDLYGDEYLYEYLRLVVGVPEWERVLDRRGVRLMLVEAGSPLAALARDDSDWKAVYGDRVAEIYQRRP